MDLLEDETAEGMQADPGYDHGPGEAVGMDEHVWTAPRNAAEITRDVGETLAEPDGRNAETYQTDADGYAAQIDALDAEFPDFFDSLTGRPIVLGDRFPLRYFPEAYDLDCYAAFPGCSARTEPSAAAIAFLTNTVKAEILPAGWYIKFSNHPVADSVAEAAGTDRPIPRLPQCVTGGTGAGSRRVSDAEKSGDPAEVYETLKVLVSMQKPL